jgi:ABC-type multidrug transport system permease subunit
VRSKSSALIVIFAPLLIILLLGLVHNTTPQYNLVVGVHSEVFTEEVSSFINLLEEDGFNVTRYEDSIEPCIDDIKQGGTHTCIVLPQSFKVEENNPKEVIFHIDPSRINLVWVIQEIVGEKFELRSQQISQELSQGVLTKLEETKGGIDLRKSEIGVIKERSATLSSETQLVQEGLAALDFMLPPTTYSGAIILKVGEDLDESATKIDEALEQIEDVNMSANNRNELIALLSEAKKLIEGSSVEGGVIEEAVEEVNGSVDKVGNEGLEVGENVTANAAQIIAALEADVVLAQAKLDVAAQQVTSSSAALAGTTTALQETTQGLTGVLSALEGLQQNIEAQKVTKAGVIAAPLTTKIEIVSEEGTFLNYLFPALLILVVMFSSLALGTTLVMIEKHSPAFFRNFFLPLRKVTFIGATYLTNLILIVVQIIVILGLSLFFLKGSIGAFPVVALILFLSASIFTFMGMVVGYIFTSEETATLASISVGSLSLFISGLILPPEAMSVTMRNIVAWNPFVIAEKLVREVFIFGASIGDVWMDVLILAGYAVGLFIVIVIMESVLHKHLVHRFMKLHHRKHKEKVH